MKALLSAVALAGAVSATPAQAVIFWSNFDVGTVVERTTGGSFPRTERTPVESFSNGASYVGVNTARWYSTYFDFTVDSSFVATNAIVALSKASLNYSQRIGFGFSHYDRATDSWESVGSFQLQTDNMSTTRVVEFDTAFGTNFTSIPSLFDFQSITFTAGETYRVRAGHWVGGAAVSNWMLSNVAAAPGTAGTGQRYDLDSLGALAFQPTLALTDGGELVRVAQAVPEPATWAMLITGFATVGGAMRRQRRALDRRLQFS